MTRFMSTRKAHKRARDKRFIRGFNGYRQAGGRGWAIESPAIVTGLRCEPDVLPPASPYLLPCGKQDLQSAHGHARALSVRVRAAMHAALCGTLGASKEIRTLGSAQWPT